MDLKTLTTGYAGYAADADAVPASLVVVFTIIVACISYYFLRQYFDSSKRSKASTSGLEHLPSPPADHWVLAEMRLHQHSGVASAHDKFGNVVVLPFNGEDTVFVRSPDLISSVFNDPTCIKSSGSWEGTAVMLNASNLVQPMCFKSFFHTHGTEWKEARRDINSVFTSLKAVDSTLVLTPDHVSEWANSDKPIDIQDEVHTLLRNTMFFMGTNRGISAKEQEAYEGVMHYFIRRFSSVEKSEPPLTATDYVLLEKIVGMAEDTVETIEKAKKKERVATSSTGYAYKNTLIDIMLNAVVKQTDGTPKRRFSNIEIARTFVNLTFAGSESTATVLAKTIAAICCHPDVQKRMEEEINVVVGEQSIQTLDQKEILKDLKYTERVIKEGFRRYPPATATTRRLTRSRDIGGYNIPAGTLVGICIHAAHLDDQVWPNPFDFDPDRFEQATKPGMWIPFGGGSRECPGKHIAFKQLKIVLISLFRKRDYKVTLNMEGSRGTEGLDDHIAKFNAWREGGIHINVKRVDGVIF